MFKAILFDLDGTLLPMDGDHFLKKYLGILSEHVSPFMKQEIFVPKLLDSTYQMINNLESNKTNKEVFIQAFFTGTDLEPEKIMPHFDEFYEKHFPKLAVSFPPEPLVPKIIKKALEKYMVVVATNPVFPKIAIEERLRWAGIYEQPFSLITSYENMHYCKPQIQYYFEILDKIKVKPEECLMVGNDVEEDLIVKEIGMKTFLVETYAINRQNIKYETDYQGDMEDLLDFLHQLS